MLTQLTIKNYALIRHLEMRPSDRLTVITGETGAGKSIMLGALGLLLGNRADTKVLWDEAEKCVAEGNFNIKAYKLKKLFEEYDLDYADQTVIRREISPGGKSRAFINDTPVTLDVMKAIGRKLMDVHSQHETLELGNHKFQLDLIDSMAGNTSLNFEYSINWKDFQQARKNYEALAASAARLKNEYDFVRFQLDELQKAGFQENEQEELESGLKIGEHGEDIKTRMNQLIAMLEQSETSAHSILSESVTLLNPIHGFSPAYEKIAKRIESLRIELDDILDEIRKEEENIEFDPAKTKEIQERLDLLYGLMQKHRTRDVKSLLEIQKTFEHQALQTVNLDEDLTKAKTTLDSSREQLLSTGEKLTASRKKVFASLTKQLVKLLHDLGIPDAALQIEHTLTEPGPNGLDQVEILFSANKGVAPRPLEEVASGGEFSRVMFCVKYVLAEKTSLPTLVLDEIDTGVSGEIAMQLGKMMKAMADKHQLIAISHLPQIAAKGDEQFLVYKDNSSRKTESVIKSLSSEERVEEIAKMIGGAKPSHLARENAREMIGA